MREEELPRIESQPLASIISAASSGVNSLSHFSSSWRFAASFSLNGLGCSTSAGASLVSGDGLRALGGEGDRASRGGCSRISQTRKVWSSEAEAKPEVLRLFQSSAVTIPVWPGNSAAMVCVSGCQTYAATTQGEGVCGLLLCRAWD